jgi:FMN phosphatase YigB (HAD superfamily)
MDAATPPARWVVFDLIGVLAGPSWRDTVPQPDLERWAQFRVGAITESEFWSADSAARYRSLLTFRLDRLDLASRLQRGCFRIAVATNFCRSWLDALLETVPSPPFDAYVVSSEIGVAKPDARFWEHLRGFVPEGSLFIDDQHRNCEAAKLAGFRSLWAHTSADLDAELSDLLALETVRPTR